MIAEELDAGDGLVLRRPRVEEAEAMGEAVTASIEHLRPFMAWISYEPVSIEDRRALIAAWNRAWDGGGDMVFTVWLGDAIVGSCGFHRRIGPGALEIGYWVHVDHINKGVATAISRALTSAAFTLPEIDFVEIHHDLGNVRSRRVPEKLGYELIAEIDGHEDANGRAGKDLVWRVTRDAWLSAGAPGAAG